MISNRNQKYVKPFEPQVEEANSIFKWEDTYKYLGIQLVRDRRGTMDDLAQSMLSAAEEICSSVLADWQKTRRHQYLCHPKGLLLPRLSNGNHVSLKNQRRAPSPGEEGPETPHQDHLSIPIYQQGPQRPGPAISCRHAPLLSCLKSGQLPNYPRQYQLRALGTTAPNGAEETPPHQVPGKKVTSACVQFLGN